MMSGLTEAVLVTRDSSRPVLLESVCQKIIEYYQTEMKLIGLQQKCQRKNNQVMSVKNKKRVPRIFKSALLTFPPAPV